MTSYGRRALPLLIAFLVAACGGDDSGTPDSGIDGGGGIDAPAGDGTVPMDGTITCEPGYELVGSACVDVDECTRGTDDCGPTVACTNTPGSFVCGDCLAGYVEVMGVCRDLNECVGEGSGAPCARIACTNTPGGFTCGACPTGWSDPMGDASVCIDFDECQGEGGGDDCHADALCTNTLGGYVCACRPGYRGDGRACAAAGAPGGFPGGPILPAGDAVRAAGGGDLDEDGELDVVVLRASTTAAENTLDVYLSTARGAWATPVRYRVGAEPWDVLVADVDEDTHLDALATNYNGNNLLHLEGDGTGALLSRTAQPGDNTRDFVLADFDRDGNLDVVYASWGEDAIRASWGDGTGAFPSATMAAAGDGPSGLCAGRFDGDLDLDLAVTNGTLSTRRVALMLGDGARGFAAPTSPIAVPTTPGHAVCADFDDDAALDVAFVTQDDVRVAFGSGSGAIGSTVTLLPGTNPDDVLAADLDVDGREDLVVASGGFVHSFLFDGTRVVPTPIDTWTSSARDIAAVDYDGNTAPDVVLGLTSGTVGFDPLGVLVGDGMGGFSAPTRLRVGAEIVVHDIDADGDLDVIATLADEVVTFVSDGAGTLTAGASVSLVAGAGPRRVSVADVDEDGRLDLVVPNAGTNDVTVLLDDGAGGYRVGGTWPALPDTEDLTIGDFDEDGHADYAVATSPSGLDDSVVLVHFGDGAGDFTRMVSFTAEHTAEIVRTADMNDDRHLDLVVGHDNLSGRITLLYGDGLGGFTLGPVLHADVGVDALEIVDFDADGVVDIVAVGGGLVTIFLGDGAGAYPTSGEHSTVRFAGTLAIGDFDEDRVLDVAAGSSGALGVCVHRGSGDGAIAAPTCYGLAAVSFMVAADLDGDTHTDLVTSDGGDLSIFFN